MSDHRSPTKHSSPRRRAPRSLRRMVRSAPVRAVLCLGVIGGLGATGTLAYWTDNATLTGGSFSSGSLDLTLDQSTPANNTTIGQGGSYAKTGLAIANMIPGESIAADVSVKNNNGVPFSYKANAKLDTSDFPTTAPVRLTFEVRAGAATNGTDAQGNRSGTCTGTVLFGPAALTSTAQDVITAARPLAKNASESICVRVELTTLADNTYQGKSATTSFVFRAAQVGQAP